MNADRNVQIENIILISFDSLRSDYIANVNDQKAPNFSLMKNEGVFFKNAIVQAPLTIPSHCSMLTGLYPANTGVRDMHHQLPSDVPSIFNLLINEGIRTISLASTPMLKTRKIKGIDVHLKLSLTQLSKYIAAHPDKRYFSFIHSWDTHTPYETKLPVDNLKDLSLNILKPLKGLKNFPGGGRINDILELQRVKRIRSKIKNQNPKILHAVNKGYLKSIETADKFLGNVLKTTKKLNLNDRTLFILMGDHGDSFNEHSEIKRQPDGRYEHGHFLYDNILKVPLIFYIPNMHINKNIHGQVQLTDIFPTILDAFNVKYTGTIDGISLWNTIIGSTDQKYREFVFSEVVRESRDLELRSIRSLKTKLIFDKKLNEYELYDLVNDSNEQTNIWPKDPHSEKDKMLKELEEFSKIEDRKTEKTSQTDKQKIEKALKDLGYM